MNTREKKLSQKYFVNKSSQLSIQCLACKKSRTFPTKTLREKHHVINVKCPCSNSFTIDIEFRKHYRRKVHFMGGYRFSTASVERTEDCLITDVSTGGLAIKLTNNTIIRESDELIVTFGSDDAAPYKFEKKIIVRHVGPKEKIGGEFIDPERKDNELSII